VHPDSAAAHRMQLASAESQLRHAAETLKLARGFVSDAGKEYEHNDYILHIVGHSCDRRLQDALRSAEEALELVEILRNNQPPAPSAAMYAAAVVPPETWTPPDRMPTAEQTAIMPEVVG
jgi:hypothetical protein